jgi:hypothetical protein
MSSCLRTVGARLGTLFFACVAGVVLCMLSACANEPSAGMSVLQRAWGGKGAEEPRVMQASYRYLRMDRPQGGVVLLARAYVDAHPLGPVSVWYSADGEVLRTRSAWLVGLVGHGPGFRVVGGDPWLSQWPVSRFERVNGWRSWDAPLELRYGVRQEWQLLRDVPPLALLKTLPEAARLPASWVSSAPPQALVADAVAWYRLRFDAMGDEAAPPWPDHWFAVRKPGAAFQEDQVLYSYQCTSPQECFHLQAWPRSEP